MYDCQDIFCRLKNWWQKNFKNWWQKFFQWSSKWWHWENILSIRELILSSKLDSEMLQLILGSLLTMIPSLYRYCTTLFTTTPPTTPHGHFNSVQSLSDFRGYVWETWAFAIWRSTYRCLRCLQGCLHLFISYSLIVTFLFPETRFCHSGNPERTSNFDLTVTAPD